MEWRRFVTYLSNDPRTTTVEAYVALAVNSLASNECILDTGQHSAKGDIICSDEQLSVGKLSSYLYIIVSRWVAEISESRTHLRSLMANMYFRQTAILSSQHIL